MMEIAEITEPELLHAVAGGFDVQTGKAVVHRHMAVLIYTPFCGTCQLAERMLKMVQATGVDAHIRKIDINYAPILRVSWKITSVPCLALIQNGTVIHKEYTMRSVDHMYQLIKGMQDAGGDQT